MGLRRCAGSRRLLGFAAATDAVKDYLAALNLSLSLQGLGHAGVEAVQLHFDVLNLPAGGAEEMVMSVEAGVITGLALSHDRHPDLADLHQSLQGFVNCRQGDGGITLLHRVINKFGRGMIALVMLHRAQDLEALWSNLELLLPKLLFKKGHFHRSNPYNCRLFYFFILKNTSSYRQPGINFLNGISP